MSTDFQEPDAEKESGSQHVPDPSSKLSGNTLSPNVDETRLVRKIDFSILPILFCANFLQFLDKVVYNVSLSSAGN